MAFLSLTVIVFEIILNLMSMFTHSNIKIDTVFERVLRWLFVTPDMHRLHHSSRENETNSNFSFNLSIWDRIFGTYMQSPALGQLDMTIGLDRFRNDKSQRLLSLLYMPFIKNIDGYAINYRDTKNAEELADAKHIAEINREKAKHTTELSSYLSAISEHALVSITDTDGTITSVNDLFCDVTGFQNNELIRQNHNILNSGTHSKVFFDNLWLTIKSKKPWRAEICNKKKNGELQWMDTAISPILDHDGNIEKYIAVRLDITERKHQDEKLRQAYIELTNANLELDTISRTDPLTQIANRRHFDEILALKLKELSRSHSPLTLIMCDIDNFKQYNDTYGHQAGDRCLKEISNTINTTFSRESDLVARYGGEEFAVILTGVGKQTAVALADKMRINVKTLGIYLDPSLQKDKLTISTGVITITPDVNSSAEMLIEQADTALYQAKNAGKDTVTFFE